MSAPDDRLPPPEPLRNHWDALLSGRAPEDGAALDPAWAETVERLHAADDAPPPSPAMIERIWAESRRRHAAMPTTGRNGHLAPSALRRSAPLATGRAATPRWHPAALRQLGARVVREVGIALIAGAVAGFLVIGGGARLIMRLSAILADPSLQGQLTEQGERIGEITFAGTLVLLTLGAAVGAAGGLVYALFRPWLPWRGWRRGLVFGLLLSVSFGSVMLEGGENPDYRTIGIPILNVCLFNLLPLGFGLLAVPLAEWLDRRLPSTLPGASRRRRLAGMVSLTGLTLVTAPAALLLVQATVVAEPAALVVVAWLLLRGGITRWAGRFERPSDLRPRPALFLTAYAALAVPVLFGLVQTLRAAGQILGEG